MNQCGYKFRFYPTAEQEQILAQTFGCVRVAYNSILSQRTQRYYEDKVSTSYGQASSLLTDLKKQDDRAWLNDVSSVPLQQSLRHQQAAFKNFFNKTAKYPGFKDRRGKQTAEYTVSGFKWDGAKSLKLAKMSEPLKIVWHRELPKNTTVSTINVSRSPSGKYHISLSCKFPDALTLPTPTNGAIGIDLGVADLTIDSFGRKSGPMVDMFELEQKLKREQRRLAKKKKGSNNRNKARIKVARAEERIAGKRLDHLHKLSLNIVSENQTICIEDLSITGMIKSAPKSLRRNLLNASLGELKRQIIYKGEKYGRQVIVVDRYLPSSKRCSDCGFINTKMDLSVREWACRSCGVTHDRDVNAALNILAAGLAVKDCGDDVRDESAIAVCPVVREAVNSESDLRSPCL